MGAIILELYNGIIGFVPGWLRAGAVVVRFVIQLVAWFGLMLGVGSVSVGELFEKIR
jgi:hypothetical protein